MGSMFGGGSKASAMQDLAAQREAEATQKQNDLMDKQQAEKDALKAEEDATKAQVEDRRRRIASGAIGRRSLFSNDETGYARVSSTLGAA
jgi:cell division protein FtsB